MKLELKHLAPYLPYGLKCQYFDDERGSMVNCDITELRIDEMTITDSQNQYEVEFYETRPILRPLRDFNATVMPHAMADDYMALKNCPINGFSHLEFNEYNNLLIYFKDHQSHYSISFDALPVMEFFYKWHFDVYGLIDEGVAIDILSINK